MGKKFILAAIVVLGAIAYVSVTGVDRSESGEIVSEGSLDVFQLRVGDCYDDRTVQDSEDSVEISGVRGVPCSQPHDNEVYSRFDMAHAEYPGEETVESTAEEHCLAQFEGFVGEPYESSILDITYIFPTQESWNAMNDRSIFCSVYHLEYEKLTGSMRGMAI